MEFRTFIWDSHNGRNVYEMNVLRTFVQVTVIGLSPLASHSSFVDRTPTEVLTNLVAAFSRSSNDADDDPPETMCGGAFTVKLTTWFSSCPMPFVTWQR